MTSQMAREIAAQPEVLRRLLEAEWGNAEAGFPAVLVAPGGPAFGEMRRLARRLTGLGVETMIISDRPALLRAATAGMPAVTVPEWLTPFVTVVPGQFLALHLALARGLDPDRPRRLAKVTLTT